MYMYDMRHNRRPAPTPYAAPAERVYIQLGRFGDAIASVPLCWLYWKQTGKKCALMVQRDFASFLEGISYIVPEIWHGDWRDVPAAKAWARMRGYSDIVVAQIYGFNVKTPHTTTSFILESWKQVGRLNDFGAPLVFDQRNKEREAELMKGLPTDKPWVLVAADGYSAPFPYREQLFDDLKGRLGESAHVIDLAPIKTDHYHDFLGMIDKAACLVTIDTGFGQLAMASKTPICALIANKPTTWHSSPQRNQHLTYIRYDDYPKRKVEMMDAVASCVLRPAAVTVRHVWAAINPDASAQFRHEIAKETWKRESRAPGVVWHDRPFTEADLKRSATDIGEKVRLPFLHDMLDKAAEGADNSDVLLITNADISLVPGLGLELGKICLARGACYAHRWDFPIVRAHINRSEITKGRWYVGCDLFAMTALWWRTNRHQLPPFVIGRECWDWVFRSLILEKGGKEIEYAIYHEKHSSPWEVNRGLPGNLHNRSYARKWLTARGIDLAEITHEPFHEVEWAVPVGA